MQSSLLPFNYPVRRSTQVVRLVNDEKELKAIAAFQKCDDEEKDPRLEPLPFAVAEHFVQFFEVLSTLVGA